MVFQMGIRCGRIRIRVDVNGYKLNMKGESRCFELRFVTMRLLSVETWNV